MAQAEVLAKDNPGYEFIVVGQVYHAKSVPLVLSDPYGEIAF